METFDACAVIVDGNQAVVMVPVRPGRMPLALAELDGGVLRLVGADGQSERLGVGEGLPGRVLLAEQGDGAQELEGFEGTGITSVEEVIVLEAMKEGERHGG